MGPQRCCGPSRGIGRSMDVIPNDANYPSHVVGRIRDAMSCVDVPCGREGETNDMKVKRSPESSHVFFTFDEPDKNQPETLSHGRRHILLQ
jgi:hypothetical protein